MTMEDLPMKKYTLPDLPYEHSALEPHYSAQLLELHHGKHHAAYVAQRFDSVRTLNLSL